MNITKIAAVAHEANRAMCVALGDSSQPVWADAPEWQRASAIAGVKFHRDTPDAGPDASHEAWRAHKVADGWVYGDVKDPTAKRHPCMVSFAELPVEQQTKDVLFRSVVHALLPLLSPSTV